MTLRRTEAHHGETVEALPGVYVTADWRHGVTGLLIYVDNVTTPSAEVVPRHSQLEKVKRRARYERRYQRRGRE